MAYVLILRGCETEEERDEAKARIYRPPVAPVRVDQDDDLPEWAEDYVPAWWGGHDQAAYDAVSGGQIKPTRQ